MRIVLAVHQFLPDYSSGTEIMTYETAKQLQRRGHEVVVFTGFPFSSPIKDADRFDRYEYDGILVERFFHTHMPMGRQSNIMELEYTNHLFAEYFREYLLEKKPDLIHFFHLVRLSTSAIDVCSELGIPTVFTPTDFWFICPFEQLRLPGNRICAGPDRHSGNCLKHLLYEIDRPGWKLIYRLMPDWLVSFIMTLIATGWNFDSKYTPLARALAARREFVRERINKIGKIIAPSEVMRALLSENHIDKNKVVHLPFGINLSYFQGQRSKKTSDILRIGFIGSLLEHKGVHIFLEAFREIEDDRIEALIYGNTNISSGYLKKIKDIVGNDRRVKFLGTFPNQEIGEILSNLDVLVMPSLWHENTPLVLYSAQAAKCPVVASDVAGISEVITHRVDGLLFEMGNPADLKRILLSLIEDRKQLQLLSSNAKTPLSMEGYAERLTSIYESLLTGDMCV